MDKPVCKYTSYIYIVIDVHNDQWVMVLFQILPLKLNKNWKYITKSDGSGQ